ncbi:MAG: hypothetical protein U1E39_13775 [Planctomycetota bacterium]
MRSTHRAVVLTVLAVAVSIAAPRSTAFAPSAARADEAADARARAIQDLMSSDDTVRAKAAKFLAEHGRAAAEELARHAELDDRALKACAEAYARGWRVYAYTFVVAARTAPPAHAARLLALAHAIHPLAGVQRTRDETAAEVRRLVDQASRARCGTGCAEEIALLGHDALEPLLAGIRASEHAGGSIECWAVGLLAEKEDVPAIRDVVLAGKATLAEALGSMQKEGIHEATDALLEAAAAGRLGSPILRALADAPDKTRVLSSVSATLDERPELAQEHRRELADFFRWLDARDSAPRLESWLATSREPEELAAIADALVKFGRVKGVGVLVRIVSEARTSFPCRPSTPDELAAASAPGRLCPEGFAPYARERAAEQLSEIAGKAVFDMPEEEARRRAETGPHLESEGVFMERAAAAFRAWWEATKDRLAFDAATGRWVVRA